MTDIKAIIQFLDLYLEKKNLRSLTPPGANMLLDQAGLLKDGKSRKGKPLRELLKDKQLPQAYYVGRYWYIVAGFIFLIGQAQASFLNAC
jgi:hypothetical protein